MDEQIKENEKLICDAIYQFYKTRKKKSIEEMVYSLALDFDDLLQVGRITYFRALKTYDNRGTFNGYFCSIFHNDLKMLTRKQFASMRQASVISISTPVGVGDDILSIEEMLPNDNNTESSALAKVIFDVLTDYERRIIQLDLNGYTSVEIGKMIGSSQSWASRLTKQIKAKLREELSI